MYITTRIINVLILDVEYGDSVHYCSSFNALRRVALYMRGVCSKKYKCVQSK